MFSGSLIWRGFVYAILMVLGKLLCGAWLLRFTLLAKMKYVTKNMTKRMSTAIRQYTPGRKSPVTPQTPPSNTQTKQPTSLYPAAILGSAMVARGEIGFLISSIAESKGLWRQPGDENNSNSKPSSAIFITVTWAILLCTFVGPIAVGLIARRVKRLESANGSERSDVLGQWRLD